MWRSGSFRELWVSGFRPGPHGPLGPLRDPQKRTGDWPSWRGGEEGKRTRDRDQPIWVLLTWPRGRGALPTPPARLGGEGLGATPPPPTQLQFPGGVDTPDYVLPPYQAAGNIGAPLEGARIQNLLQRPHCREQQPDGRPAATPLPPRPTTPTRPLPAPCGLANGRAANGTTCSGPAVATRTELGRLERLCWRGRRGAGAGGSGEMASAPLPASLFPWSRRAAAQPIGSEIWRAAASLWVYAALLPGD